jgi:hypothetical protein
MSVSEDLDYLRDLAEAGQRSPLLGGRFMVWWGALAMMSYGAHASVASQLVSAPAYSLALIWLAFGILGPLGSAILGRAMDEGKPGASSAGNRVQRAVWIASGLAFIAFFAGVVIVSITGKAPSAGFEWSVPFVFAIYGIAQITSGSIAGHFILRLAGGVSFAVVLGAVLLVGTVWLYWLAAAGAGLVILVPGLALLRAEPATVV